MLHHPLLATTQVNKAKAEAAGELQPHSGGAPAGDGGKAYEAAQQAAAAWNLALTSSGLEEALAPAKAAAVRLRGVLPALACAALPRAASLPPRRSCSAPALPRTVRSPAAPVWTSCVRRLPAACPTWLS